MLTVSSQFEKIFFGCIQMHGFISKFTFTSRVTQVSKDILGKNVDPNVVQLLLKLDWLNFGTYSSKMKCADVQQVCTLYQNS